MLSVSPQERDSDIELKERQWEEFAEKKTAFTAVAAGEEGGMAVAERPAGGDWDIPSSWRPSEATMPRSD